VGRIPDEDIAKVREASDLAAVVQETVSLRQRGRLWWGLCPFHAEKTPSFKIDPATQLWYCFGCSEGGDVIRYVMRRDNLEFADSVRLLAERARIEIREEGTGLARGEKERLQDACAAAADFYHKRLVSGRDPGATAAREYLAGRGFGSETAKRFHLGYAPSGRDELARSLTAQGVTADELVAANLAVRADDGRLKDRFFNRVMFPIEDLAGKTIAFGGRVIGEGHPKYLNSQETPVFHKSDNLYGLSWARNPLAMSGTAIVVEGYTDVIALHEAGITNAVATLGTALSARHVRILARFAKRVVYLFDGDEAGQRAADRAAGFLDLQATPEASEGKVDFRVAVIPGSADPADFVTEAGAEALRGLVDDSPPLLRFLLDRRLADGDPATPEGRSVALRSAAGVLAGLRGSILAHDYIEYVAGRLLVDHDTVEAAIRETTARVQVGTGRADDTRPEGKPRTRLDMEALVELEVLALAARYPMVRPEARELLAEDLVTDPDRAALLSSIIEAGDATGAGLLSMIEQRRPGSAEVLSAASVDEPTREQAEPVFTDLAGRLREIGLRRRISALQARMRALDPRQDRQEYDQAFAEAAELRKRLERERSESASSDITEA